MTYFDVTETTVNFRVKYFYAQVNIDIVNFGEDEENADILNKFITTINGKEGTGSHLVTIPPGPHLSDALVSSPIVQGEDGGGAMAGAGAAGFEFGVNPDDDPELALALRVSMEEQRARQQAEGGAEESAAAPPAAPGLEDGSSEEALLQRALAMSMDTGEAPAQHRDLNTMTEEEQIAYAMQVNQSASEKFVNGLFADVHGRRREAGRVCCCRQ